MPRASNVITLPEPVPYDDDYPWVVSYSELDTYRQCPLKHFISYKERWTKPPGPGSPLSKGSLWHAVLEAHYSVIKAWQDENGGRILIKDEPVVHSLAVAAVRPLLFDSKGKQTPDQALIQWMYEGYLDKHGSDRGWRILAVEYKLAAFLPTPDGESEFILKAKLDLIVQDLSTKMVWVVDHKSGANLPTQFELDLDDQFGLYQWLLVNSGLKVMGTIFNASRTTKNLADDPAHKDHATKRQTLDQRNGRFLMGRTPIELQNIALDAYNVALHAYPPEGMELPMYSSPDIRQCGWKCDFKEVHLMTRKGRDLTDSLTEYGFVQDFTRH